MLNSTYNHHYENFVHTDFSANADHALNYAALLGKAMNPNLILLHVYTPPVTRKGVKQLT